MATITRGELQDIHYSFYESKQEIETQAIRAYIKAVKVVGLNDVIMVTPMRKNEGLTVTTLNRLIQAKIIKDKSRYIENKDSKFYLGDKIIQRENDYTGKGVINGEMGYIEDILQDRSIIKFIDREVEYTKDDLKQIELAYCISGHKYQGSQAKIIIIILHTTHYKMLSKQWLYTAITRAIETDYIIAHPQAFAMAIATDHTTRKTFLQHIIKQDRNDRENNRAGNGN